MAYIHSITGKVKHPFDFSKKRMAELIEKLFRDFIIHYKCTLVMSFLNSAHYFAAYLQTSGHINEPQRCRIQADCAALFHTFYPNFKEEYTETLCFSKFPRWG